jgi:hypothetical protein
MKKYCVYTTLLGNYEKLNEQPVAKDSEIDFICFTDNADIVSQTWKIIKITPVFPLDSSRSSRLYKIKPHLFLQDYQTSLYIDNSVILKIAPDKIFKDLLKNEIDAIFIKHSFRETVLDEFIEVLKLNYDYPTIILEQLDNYYRLNPDLLSQKPLWGGFIIRNHNTPSCIDTMEEWLAQVFRFSRRDQLSLNYVLTHTTLKYDSLELDNLSSDYYNWPSVTRYGNNTINSTKDRISNSHALIISTLNLELSKYKMQTQNLNAQVLEQDQTISNLTKQVSEQTQLIRTLTMEKANLNEQFAQQKSYLNLIIGQLQGELQQAKDELSTYASSTSWQITRPFRKIMRFVRRK